MEPAFWDASALVRLCLRRQATPTVVVLGRQYSVVTWWATPVEIQSAFARLLRMGQLTSQERVGGQVRLEELRTDWREVEPREQLRQRAESLVDRFNLRAADALQLAAALTWSTGHPRNRPFLSGDKQLLDAARQLGFHAIET